MPTLSSANSVAANEQAGFRALAGSRVKTDWLKQALAWLVLPVTFGLAITHQSLWMDEGYTVWFAAHKTFGSFLSALMGAPGATGDPQMLFYLLYMWGWVKVFGESEFALRAANIPFALLFLGAMAWAAERFLKLSNLWVLFCLSPFFWFYLNDARPYVALMTFATAAIVALLAYLEYPTEYARTAPWCSLIALLFMWGTHILGALLFPSILVMVLAAAVTDENLRSRFVRDWSRPLLCCLPVFLALGAFFVWASAHGVSKERGESGFSNLAFALYEFTGFSGLGPPRLELRQTPHPYIFAPYWQLLAFGAVPMLFLGYLTFRKRPSSTVRYLGIGLIVGVATAIGLAKIEHFQILGRHMAVFFPLLWMMLMLWAKPLFSSPSERNLTIATVLAVGVVWAVSDARLISLSKYERDSFRNAVSIAETKARQDDATILWVADTHAAAYYGIRATKILGSSETGNENGLGWRVTTHAIDAQNWSPEEAASYVSTSKKPLILVVSRPDLFDNTGAWHALIQQQQPMEVAQLTAFSIYEWQPRVGAAHASAP